MAGSDDGPDWRDANFAANMVRFRTDAGISQADLVQRLRSAPNGRRWRDVHQTTISRIEKGERQVRMSEAFCIAAALGFDSADEMIRPPYRVDAERQLAEAQRRVVSAYNAIGANVFRLIRDRRRLKHALEEAKKVMERDSDEKFRERVAETELYLNLRVDGAVRAGREAWLDDRPNELDADDFERFYGVADVYGYYGGRVSEGDMDAPEA